MATYRLTPRALQGLEGIIEYVDRTFGTTVAGKVLDRLDAAFQALASRPDVGHRRPDLTDDASIRFWSVGPTLIAYRRGREGVEVLFVERASRDWAAFIPNED